jgi:ABC-type nitrate/sulfonate/bicarbonate transport system permease component
MPNALPYIRRHDDRDHTRIIGVIVSVLVASQQGIGYLIELSSSILDTPLMMAAITFLSLQGIVLYAIIAGAERRATIW